MFEECGDVVTFSQGWSAFLQGDRVTLRVPREDDVEFLLENENDVRDTKFLHAARS